MAKLTLEIITGEQLLLREEEIDEVIAPGSVGELGDPAESRAAGDGAAAGRAAGEARGG